MSLSHFKKKSSHRTHINLTRQKSTEPYTQQIKFILAFFMSKLKSLKDLVLLLVRFGDMGNVLLRRVLLHLFS